MPSPGAVCPSMVTSPFFMIRLLFRAIVPDTSNTMIRFPEVFCSASRRDPVPESLRLVTWSTFPPLPPVVVYLANPSAPGKAGACAVATAENMAAATIVVIILFIFIYNNV